MSARPILAFASVVILAAAAACVNVASSDATLTATQTLRRARADGFTHVVRARGCTGWHCTPTSIRLAGAVNPQRGYVRSQYQVSFGDRREPPTATTPLASP